MGEDRSAGGSGGLPSGTVTFLFTDIEGSTGRAGELGDERWAAVLAVHHELLRRAFDAHDGVVIGTEGDAFFVVFERASDAAAAALAGQRALETHDWSSRLQVRMGLHTGEALVRDGDYVGHEVHRAKRIADAGHGGQIVLSQTTADLVREALPDGAWIVDLGPHRLKDMAETQILHQLTSDGLQAEFPPLRSLGSFPNNLPAQRSTFVGRERAVGDVRELLDQGRLVTLTGVGGCGKTRLAVEVGAAELSRHPDGVFFCDLAPLADPDLVTQTLCRAVGVVASGGIGGSPRPLEDTLTDFLRRRDCLLILDNCEHLLDVCADLADRLLSSCAELRALATSREALGIEGEQGYRVPSLSLPDDRTDADRSEAVSLFVSRARDVAPTFELTSDTLPEVVEICRRLDGIPLAIEFAAARISHLSTRQIAERLGDMFRLLTGGRRRVQRQQTLEAALDWSYELLEEPERMLLRRLSVFAGDFDLAAAEEICGDEVLPAADVVDRLGSLVTKSLLTTVATPAAVRYRLLETVRTYAAGKLRDAGEADTVRAGHRDRYLSWLEAIPYAEAYAGTTSLAAISRELDNLRAAMDLCVAEDRPDLLGRMATQMTGLFGSIGMPDEGHRWLSIALADPDRLDPHLRARCYTDLSHITMMKTEPGAVDTARRALDLAGDRDPETLAFAFAQYALVLSVQAAITQDPELVRECRECAGRAIQVAEDLEPVWQVRMRIRAAWVELDLGDVARARELLDGAAAVCPEGFDTLMSSALSGLAVTSHVLGHHEDAARYARAALRYREAEASPDLIAEVAPAIAAGGDVELARELLRDALLRSRRGGVPIAVNANLVLCGVVECLVGRWDRASRLLAAARHLGGAAGLPVPFRSPEGYTWYRHYLPLVREALGPEEARRGRDEGRAMSEDEAIAYALEGLA